MTSKVVYIDTLLDYQINQNTQRLEAGDLLTVFGIELTGGDLVACAGLFENDPMGFPVGGFVKSIGRVYLNRDDTSSSMRVVTKESGQKRLEFPGCDCKVLDTRFMIYREFAVIVGPPIRSETHLRLRRLSGQYITELIDILDEKCNSEELHVGKEDRMLFVETFTDTKSLEKEPDSLHISLEENNGYVCSLLPRTIALRRIADLLRRSSPAQRIPRTAGFPFPVISNQEGTGIWISNQGSIRRDIHYEVLMDIPDDAIILRDGYDFYHYEVDGYSDAGWGCAYRGIQTMASWFANLHNLITKVPSIEEIQRILKRADYAHNNILIGGRTWIGCYEGSTVLSELSGGKIQCRVLHADCELNLSELIFNAVRTHLLVFGSPVMIGAGDYAYIVGGVSISTARVLIIDPHYTGRSTIEPCSWKRVSEFLDFRKIRGTFVNVCLPYSRT